jgi:hypothetical protein
MFKGLGIICAVALLLAGCGATSSGTNNNGGGSPNYAGQAQGVYSGTTSDTNFFESIVLPNDKFYEVYGTLTGNAYSVSGMVTGQGKSGNGTFTANVADFRYTGQTFLDSIVASVVPGSSVGGTLIPIGQLSGVSFSGTSLPAASFKYNTPASLTDISGSWTGTLLDGTSTTVNIDSKGALNASASGCIFSGTMVPDPSNKNFFDASLTFESSPCVFPNQTATGIAVDSLLPDGVTHQLLIAVTSGISEGTVFLAQRPNGGGNNLGALNGQYAFQLAGFDPTGNPMSIAGSIKSDGLGHVTAGEVDINDNGAISSNSSVSGTYAFDSNIPLVQTYAFQSNIQNSLGTITLTYTVGNVSYPLAFGFSLQGSPGFFGQIMSLDTNNFIASGTMQLQYRNSNPGPTPVVTLSNLAGDYVVALNGRSANNPTSALGRLTLASSGASTNVTFDRSIAGIGAAGPTTGASANLAFGSAGPDANGRGTFTLTLNDALASTTQNFAYYVVNVGKIVAVEADGNGTMTAEFSRQNTPFTAATVATSGSVFAMTGVDTVAASNEITAVGQLQITGVGADTGTLRWDSNDAGVILGPASFAGQTVHAFDTTTGRGTVTIAGGALSGLADSVAFYLTAPGTGFLMDTTTGVFNRAMLGTLSAQAGGPYSASTDLAGLGIVRSRGSSVNDALSFVGLFGLTTTPATYATIFDQRFAKSGIVQTQMDQSIPGITVQALDQITGRGTLLFPIGTKTATKVFYVIAPYQFAFIDVSPVSSGLNGPSNLFFVNAH